MHFKVDIKLHTIYQIYIIIKCKINKEKYSMIEILLLLFLRNYNNLDESKC